MIHFLYYYITQNLGVQQFFCNDNDKTWLPVLFLGVITFHLFGYLEIKVKKNYYWSEYVQ